MELLPELLDDDGGVGELAAGAVAPVHLLHPGGRAIRSAAVRPLRRRRKVEHAAQQPGHRRRRGRSHRRLHLHLSRDQQYQQEKWFFPEAESIGRRKRPAVREEFKAGLCAGAACGRCNLIILSRSPRSRQVKVWRFPFLQRRKRKENNGNIMLQVTLPTCRD